MQKHSLVPYKVGLRVTISLANKQVYYNKSFSMKHSYSTTVGSRFLLLFMHVYLKAASLYYSKYALS